MIVDISNGGARLIVDHALIEAVEVSFGSIRD